MTKGDSEFSQARCAGMTEEGELSDYQGKRERCSAREVHRRAVSSPADLVPQITPFVIEAIDELQLPCASPLFELLLTSDGGNHRGAHFEIDQPMRTIALGEARHDVVAMQPDASGQIRRHADIKRAVATVGENVDSGMHGCIGPPGELL